MPIGAIVAGVAGASAVGAGVTASATKKAAKAAKQSADESIALQRDIYGQNKGLLSPFVDRGNAAGDRLSAFLGLGGDPVASQKAFDSYLDSTGYRFQLSQGLSGITSQKATAGLLNSGSTLKALDKYSTGLAQGWTDNYLGHLSDLAGQGQSAAGSLAGVGEHYADAVTGENNYRADAVGNAALANASNINGLIASGLGAFGAGLTSFIPDVGSRIGGR